MPTEYKEKTDRLIQASAALGKVGLLIVENEKGFMKARAEAGKIMIDAGYKECSDYSKIMDALSNGEEMIFYAEKGKRLDSSVLEIISEFEAGIVSLADRVRNTGLQTAKWNPSKTSFIAIMTRKQTEQSYPRLFEYINITQSI